MMKRKIDMYQNNKETSGNNKRKPFVKPEIVEIEGPLIKACPMILRTTVSKSSKKGSTKIR